MRRRDLEHIIRAAGSIAETRELIILGSQSILGSFPDAPAELLLSQEVDTYPLDDPGKADLIDGSIGELSPFHEAFGYYAHGVGPETAILPACWKQRCAVVCTPDTHGITGYCLHPADLAVSKLLAGREKDFQFVSALLRHQLVAEDDIRTLFAELSGEYDERAEVHLRICAARLNENSPE